MAMGSPSGNKGPAGSANGLNAAGYEKIRTEQFTPEQMQLFQSMFSQLGPNSQTAKLAGGDQSSFDQLEAPAMRQFGELQGQLASRFSGAGMGARRSSGFQNASTQATQDFASQLQSQRMGIQRQALSDLMGMSNQLLNQRPYEDYLTEKANPWWHSLVSAGLPIAGAAVGGFAGGVPGALAGGYAGVKASKAFTGR